MNPACKPDCEFCGGTARVIDRIETDLYGGVYRVYVDCPWSTHRTPWRTFVRVGLTVLAFGALVFALGVAL